jgi:hypothetical protein
MLKTVDEVVEAFGGTTELARLLDVGAPAVSNAKERGAFPYRWHMILWTESERRGLRIDPRLVGREPASARAG